MSNYHQRTVWSWLLPVIIGIVVFAGVAVGIIAIVLHHNKHESAIQNSGQVAYARPAGVTSEDNGDSTEYRAWFTYSVDDTPYLIYEKEDTEANAYLYLKQGDPQVRYLKSDPSDGRLSFGSNK